MKQENLSSVKTLHTLFSIFIPGVFLVVFSQTLNLLFNGLLGINNFTIFFIFLTALEEAIVGYILYQEKVEEFERLREILLLMVLIIGGKLLITSGTWSERLDSLLTIPFIALCIIIICQWIASFTIHVDLRQREIFLQSIEKHTGNELALTIRKNVLMFDIVQAKIKNTKTMLIIFQLLCITSIGLVIALAKPIPLLLLGFNAFHIILCCFCFVALNRMLEENNLLSEGIRPGALYKRKQTYYILFMFIVIIVIAFLAAKDTSLFSLSSFLPLLNWLLNLFNGKKVASRPEAPHLPGFNFLNLKRYFEQTVPDGEGNIVLQILGWGLVIFTYILLLAIIIGLLYFLLSPFFSRYFRLSFKWQAPFRFIAKIFRGLFSGLKQFWQDFVACFSRKAQYTTKKGTKEREQEILELREAKKLKLIKRLQMRNFIKAFLKLAYWGASKKNLTYEKHQGPMEYGLKLMAAAPEQAEAIRTALEIFEEGLFSQHLVEKDKVKSYYKLVREIIRSV